MKGGGAYGKHACGILREEARVDGRGREARDCGMIGRGSINHAFAIMIARRFACRAASPKGGVCRAFSKTLRRESARAATPGVVAGMIYPVFYLADASTII